MERTYEIRAKGVSKNRGTPKWMVYNGSKPYEQMDDLGLSLFLETPIRTLTILNFFIVLFLDKVGSSWFISSKCSLLVKLLHRSYNFD